MAEKSCNGKIVMKLQLAVFKTVNQIIDKKSEIFL